MPASRAPGGCSCRSRSAPSSGSSSWWRCSDLPAEPQRSCSRPRSTPRCRPPRASTTSAAGWPSSRSLLNTTSATSATSCPAGIVIAMAFLRPVIVGARPDGCSTPSAGMTVCPGRAGSSRFRTDTACRSTRSLRSSSSRGCSTVAAGVVGGGTAIVIVTAISTIFLVAAYGILHLPRRDDAGLAEGARLEPRAAGQSRSPWVVIFRVVVLTATCSASRRRATSRGRSWLLRRPSCRCIILRLGMAKLQGSAFHGRRRRADRDRTRIHARRRRGRGGRRPRDLSAPSEPASPFRGRPTQTAGPRSLARRTDDERARP